jgi:hypothetical protein
VYTAPPPRRDRSPSDITRAETRLAGPREVRPPAAPPLPRQPPTAREQLLNARSPLSAKRDGARKFRDAISDMRDLGGATAKSRAVSA